MVWYEVGWYGMWWNGMVWYGMRWNGMWNPYHGMMEWYGGHTTLEWGTFKVH